MAKTKKKTYQVYIWNENPQVRKNTSYKKRQQYYENKQTFPKKKLKIKKWYFFKSEIKIIEIQDKLINTKRYTKLAL